MKVGLFIYIDAFFPEVGIATLELLEKLGVEVVYPLNQTCCGQPMANAGSQKDAAGVEALFVKKDFWYSLKCIRCGEPANRATRFMNSWSG